MHARASPSLDTGALYLFGARTLSRTLAGDISALAQGSFDACLSTRPLPFERRLGDCDFLRIIAFSIADITLATNS